jgi:Ctr copper transporter family
VRLLSILSRVPIVVTNPCTLLLVPDVVKLVHDRCLLSLTGLTHALERCIRRLVHRRHHSSRLARIVARAQREFDRYLSRPYARNDSETGSGSEEPGTGQGQPVQGGSIRNLSLGRHSDHWQLKGWQQAIRSLLYMLQFAVGYFVMFLAMYYNGES